MRTGGGPKIPKILRTSYMDAPIDKITGSSDQNVICNNLYGFDMTFSDILNADQVKKIPKCKVQCDILMSAH